MKKRLLFSFLFVSIVSISLLLGSNQVFAHGYIAYPESRVYLGQKGINKDVGPAKYEPQSIEAKKGFPEGGPADGHIPSGDNMRFGQLDEQSEDRWVKVDVPTGKIELNWFLTAPHRTSGWKYYITKKGWNPNAPLTRDELELLTYIKGDGSVPQDKVKQTINIPNDRVGYYIILGVWEIADTPNAFYQVIDANIVNPNKKVFTIPAQMIETYAMNSDRWYLS